MPGGHASKADECLTDAQAGRALLGKRSDQCFFIEVGDLDEQLSEDLGPRGHAPSITLALGRHDGDRGLRTHSQAIEDEGSDVAQVGELPSAVRAWPGYNAEHGVPSVSGACVLDVAVVADDEQERVRRHLLQ